MTKLTITTGAPLKKGDRFTMNVPKYRRKYWLFGKWIQIGTDKKMFVVK